jgi:hypothetical protein
MLKGKTLIFGDLAKLQAFKLKSEDSGSKLCEYGLFNIMKGFKSNMVLHKGLQVLLLSSASLFESFP